MKEIKELQKIWQQNGLSIELVKALWERYFRLFKYLIVGFSTAFVKLIIFTILLYLPINRDLDLPLLPVIFGFQIAETIAYLLSLLYNYLSHKFWTFQQTSQNNGEVMKYIVLAIFNYIVGIIILTFLVKIIGLPEIISQIGVIGLASMWNFVLMKKVIYKVG